MSCGAVSLAAALHTSCEGNPLESRMLFLVFLASASAIEPDAQCRKKGVPHFYVPENPVTGSCETSGLGWKGRDAESYPDGDKDQFFTKWTDLFQKPECVDKIEVHISDTAGGEESQISTLQNPSNTILIADQLEAEICRVKPFQSRLVFFPKFFEKGVPCFELKRQITLSPHLSLATFFLNNKEPIIETAQNNSTGVASKQLHTSLPHVADFVFCQLCMCASN